jgi:hypothetical protein
MNEFQLIDGKLREFAQKHNAKLLPREIGFDSESADGRDLRKILWDDGMFSKAIFIRPHITYDHRSSDLWDFSIHACVNDDRPGEIPFWTKDLLQGVQFPKIEERIDHLLAESEKLLSAVKVEDMRIDWTWIDGKLVD